jgi:hypothetical protein
MPYATGTATSIEQFKRAMRSFAVRTLGNFSDPFEGSYGVSPFPDSSGTVAFQHKDTGATYLFDFINGLSMNNLSSETVIVGQLLDTLQGRYVTNYQSFYISDESVSMRTLLGTLTATLSVVNGVSTYSGSVVHAAGSALLNVSVGSALIFKENATVRHILEVTVVDSTAQTFTAIYKGSYNLTTGSTDQDAVFTLPSTYSGTYASGLFRPTALQRPEQTPIGSFSSNLWNGDELTPVQIAEGWLPRSGRLDFNAGVEYEFYGDASSGNEYFHMVLNTKGDYQEYEKPRSHWWMGRVSGNAAVLQGSAIPSGLFLGTTGPHTDAYDSDTYQYPFSYSDAGECWKNPCIMTAAISDSGTNSFKEVAGGRNAYGPTGASHDNQYGPGTGATRTLASTRYSIQAGLNDFTGGHSYGMRGARGRTYYPLRPGPVDVGFVSLAQAKPYYISPFAKTHAILTQLPRPEVVQTRSVAISPDPQFYGPDMFASTGTDALGFPRANTSSFGSTMSLENGLLVLTGTANDSGLMIGNNDSSIGMLHTPIADYDRVEVRLRLRRDATPSANWEGKMYWTALSWSSGAQRFNEQTQITLPEPAGFRDGKWVTLSYNPTTHPNWLDNRGGGPIFHVRFDFINTSSPSVQPILEIDYVTVGETRLQRNSRYGYHKASYMMLGEFPGVWRGTESSGQITTEATLGEDTYVYRPVYKKLIVGGKQRSLKIDGHSGWASYVYKR